MQIIVAALCCSTTSCSHLGQQEMHLYPTQTVSELYLLKYVGFSTFGKSPFSTEISEALITRA